MTASSWRADLTRRVLHPQNAARLANMVIRGLGLVGRFVLTLAVARFCGLAATGVFGLVQGAAGSLPAVTSFGLNYMMNREIIGQEPGVAAPRVRDKLVVSAAPLVISVVGAVTAILWTTGVAPAYALLIAPALYLEAAALDTHNALISLKRAVLANALFFVRSALWVFPTVLAMALYPSLRTLGTIFTGWLLGLLANAVLLGWALRSWPWRRIARTPVEQVWLKRAILSGWLIYLSDLGIAAQAYVERYVVNGVLGLHATGLYTLYWSIANAVYGLILAAIVQVTLPGLVQELRQHGEARWVRLLRREVLTAFASAIGLSAVIAAIVLIGLPLLKIGRDAADPALLITLLAGACIRIAADSLNYGLYSKHLDRAYALINIAGMGLSLVVSYAAIRAFGMAGAGVASVVTPLTLFAVRLWVLARSRVR